MGAHAWFDDFDLAREDAADRRFVDEDPAEREHDERELLRAESERGYGWKREGEAA